jgi:hypothetical protein
MMFLDAAAFGSRNYLVDVVFDWDIEGVDGSL